MTRRHVLTRKVRRTFSSAEDKERFRRLLESKIREADRDFRFGLSGSPTILEKLEEFLRDQRVLNANEPVTLAGYRRRLTRFARDLSNGAGDIPVDRITRDDLLAWIDRRLREPGRGGKYEDNKTISREVINHDVGALQCFARWCIRRGYYSEGLPVLSVRRLKLKKRRQGRYAPRSVSRHEFLRILDRLKPRYPQVEIVLRSMLLFGARPGALCLLTWRDVTMPRRNSLGRVRRPPLKGASATFVPIAWQSGKHKALLEARELFCRFRGRAPRRGKFKDPVFVTTRGNAWTTSMFDDALANAAERVGIKERFTPYVARHSAVNFLAATPEVSSGEIQAYAAHLRVSTQDFYRDVSGQNAERAYAVMEDYLGGNGKGPTQHERAEVTDMPATSADQEAEPC